MTAENRRTPILIAGPTAAGKSALALALAERIGGAVINADALQVYADWRLLTARPTAAEAARASHFLYGHVDAATPDYSVGRWLAEMADTLAECERRALTPIVVGGAGLYFTALTEGLAEIPPIPPERRTALMARFERDGLVPLAAELGARDPATAVALDIANPRRVLRALEVLDHTGLGMAEWAARTPPPLIALDQAVALLLTPERDWLEARIRRRLAAMIAAGALDEVAATRARGLASHAPAMQPIGIGPFAAHLDGRTSLEAAIERAAVDTRRYAKRQRTWARSHFHGWRPLDPAQDWGSEDTLRQLLRGGG